MIGLSLKLHIPVNVLAKQLTVEQVMEYMAYDLADSEDFREQVKRDKELEKSRKLSEAEYSAQFKKLLGG